MFCEKCGRPIPEGQQSCQFCNPPAQAPEAAYNAPAVEQPAFQVNMPAEGAKKKKKGSKLPLILIALVLVAGIVLAAVNWKSINRFFVRSFGEPVAYLADVEQEAADSAAKDLAALYDEALAAYDPKGSASEISLTLEATEGLTSLLQTALAQSGTELDLSWVESIGLSPAVQMYESTMRMDVGVALNTVTVATVSFIWDMENQMLYIGVPELHDTYIEMDAYELLGSEAGNIAYNMAQSRQLTEQMLKALPSGQVLESLISRYVGIALAELEEAEKETETVKAGGLEQKLTVLTVELSQKDVLKLAKAVLKEAKGDKELEDVLDGLSDLVSEMNGYEVDLAEDFEYAVEDILDELDDLIDEAQRGDFITIETFLDGSDAIVGRTVTLDNGYEEIELYYITVTEGKKFAFKAEAGTVRIDGEGTVEKGKRSGSYTLSESGTDYVTLELEDYIQAEDGSITGTLRLIPDAAVFDMMDMPAALSGMLGAVSVELGSDSVRLSIGAKGSELLALSLSGQSSKPSPIQIPEGVSVDDDEAGMQWISELDLDGVLADLKKAGVPEQYMEMAEQLVELFRSEFN